MARPCRPETLLENAKKGNKKKCTKRKSWDSRLGVEDTRTYSSRERKIYHTWRVRLANVISQNAHTFSLVSLYVEQLFYAIISINPKFNLATRRFFVA